MCRDGKTKRAEEIKRVGVGEMKRECDGEGKERRNEQGM